MIISNSKKICNMPRFCIYFRVLSPGPLKLVHTDVNSFELMPNEAMGPWKVKLGRFQLFLGRFQPFFSRFKPNCCRTSTILDCSDLANVEQHHSGKNPQKKKHREVVNAKPRPSRSIQW